MEAQRAFVAVVREGSFTAAATQLSLPKSTVSRRVAGLEEQLGVSLLARTTRAVRPTDLGLAYYERVRRIVASLDEANASVTEQQTAISGPLRVTAPSTLGHFYLSQMVLAFAEEQPAVQVELHLTDRLVNVVEEGFDVAIRAGKLQPSSLIARRLGDTGPVLCASPSYLATAPPLDRSDQLTNHDCLVNDQVAWGARWDLGDGRPVRVRPRLSSNSWEVLREAALTGLGVALMPDVHVSQDIAAGRLIRLLPDRITAADGLWVMYTPHRYLSPKVRAFVDHLVRAFSAKSTKSLGAP